MLVLRNPEIFYIDVDENLENKIEFIISNESLVENKIKIEIEHILSKKKHGNNIYEYTKQEKELIKSKQMNQLIKITNAVNESLRNQILTLERQCWSNAKYFRRETLKISGIPENIDDGELEGKVLTVLSKLDVNIDPANVEACHWLKSNNKGKKTILKLSRRKDSDEIRI